jgi:hypothetical protein
MHNRLVVGNCVLLTYLFFFFGDLQMIDNKIKVGACITCSDTVGFDDYSIVTTIKNGKVITKDLEGKVETIDLKSGEAFFYYECNKDGTTPRMTQEYFLNRIQASDSKLKESFTNEALIALHSELYSFYRETLPNDFDIDSILRDWKEFDSAASAEAHCQIAMQQIPDLIIKFDTGVLVQVDEI